MQLKKKAKKADASIEKEDSATMEGNVMASEEHTTTNTKGSGGTMKAMNLMEKWRWKGN